MRRFLVLLFFGVSPYIISQVTVRPNSYQAQDFIWNEQKYRLDSDTLLPGIAVYWESYIDYRKNGVSKFKVHLKEPIKIFEAKEQLAWGFVQFPKIFKIDDGRLAVTWSLNPDLITASNKNGWKYSKDQGKIWTFKWKDRPSMPFHELPNGDLLRMASYFPKTDTMSLPQPFYSFTELNGKRWKFYNTDDVDNSYLGFFQNRINQKEKSVVREKVKIYDDNRVSYSQNGIFPQQSWGNIKSTGNGVIIKYSYPSFYKDKEGKVLPSGINFYCSNDNAKSWHFQGSLSYEFNTDKNIILGLTEPTIEILDNGDLLCVVRTSPSYQTGAMLMARSKDLGKSWSKFTKISNNGVFPQLLTLNNGVKVLSSGRPGVQVRFSIDSLAEKWSEPFEMMRYHGLSGQVSCGYTGMVAISNNSFLLVYSNFRNRDDNNNLRKAIFVREIEISKS